MNIFLQLLGGWFRLVTVFVQLIFVQILLSLTKLYALFVRFYVTPMIRLSGRILGWVYKVVRKCKEKLSIHEQFSSREELEKLMQAFTERFEWQLYTLASVIGTALILAPIVGVIHWQISRDITRIKAETEILKKEYEVLERLTKYSCNGNPCFRTDPTRRYNEKGELDENGTYRVVLD